MTTTETKMTFSECEELESHTRECDESGDEMNEGYVIDAVPNIIVAKHVSIKIWSKKNTLSCMMMEKGTRIGLPFGSDI
ncbi:hypothetical protein [Ferdinandcohnia sp. SAFN-114]|uniref:hypothetical protein n=1 Tax=Ferdinandcohnia sp. SAFN-114 TaxID=3387275 RepID=UPI003F7F4412